MARNNEAEKKPGVTIQSGIMQSRATIRGALLQVGGGIAVAVITWFLTSLSSGKTVNVSLSGSESFIANLRTGLGLTLAGTSPPKVLTDSKKAQEPAVVCPPVHSTEQQNSAVPATQVTLPPDPGLDPEVLKRCKGMEPLTMKRVFVSSNQTGYHAVLELQNDSATSVSLLSQFREPFKISTERETLTTHTVLADEGINLANARYTPENLKAAFAAGIPLKPNETTSLTVDWNLGNALGEQATISTGLFYVVQGEDGQLSPLNRPFSCSGVPISKKQQ